MKAANSPTVVITDGLSAAETLDQVAKLLSSAARLASRAWTAGELDRDSAMRAFALAIDLEEVRDSARDLAGDLDNNLAAEGGGR